jgi:hypothetical protein
MKRFSVWVVAVLALAATAGCSIGGVSVNLKHVPNPVMVGPVMRIGDTAPFVFTMKEYSSFSGQASLSIMAASGSQREGDYIVHRSSRTQEEYDDVAHQISKETSGRSDLVVVVDSLRAGNRSHWSIVATTKEWIALEGRIFDPAVLQRRAKK